MNNDVYKSLIIQAIIIIAAFAALKYYYIVQSAKVFHGEFSMDFPEDWEMLEKSETLVVYATKDKLPGSTKPEAAITVWQKELMSTDWIDERIFEIQEELVNAGNTIVGKGETQRNNHKLFWLLYVTRDRQVLNLEYYAITPMDVFVRVQFHTHPDLFSQYQPVFSDVKDTIWIKGDPL